MAERLTDKNTEANMPVWCRRGNDRECECDRKVQQQQEAGRRQIYRTTWEQFESGIIEQLTGALGGAGFDPARDIAGLTVNRWPQGYAYEYNELSDPAHYGPDNGPHRLGARQMGRISVANSDASAYAFVDGAIDAAWRATREQPG